MALIDYRGFRVLAMALSPLDGDKTLIYSPLSSNTNE